MFIIRILVSSTSSQSYVQLDSIISPDYRQFLPNSECGFRRAQDYSINMFYASALSNLKEMILERDMSSEKGNQDPHRNRNTKFLVESLLRCIHIYVI